MRMSRWRKHKLESRVLGEISITSDMQMTPPYGRKWGGIKDPLDESYGFSSSHVWMWELDYKESWVLKNWCFWTVVLEKTLESPLDCKEIQPVHPKGNQFWIFIGRTDAEAETPILWPPHAKSWLIGKDPNSVKDWGQEEMGTTEDEMAGWHHQLNRHEFEWTPGVGDGQGGLACCSPWAHKESDKTEWLNWTEELLYNDVSVSAVQQNESALCIHISVLIWISFPFRYQRALQQVRISLLVYT